MFLPGKLLGKTKIELVTTFPRVLEIPDQRDMVQNNLAKKQLRTD
jgi:hypothetical protein